MSFMIEDNSVLVKYKKYNDIWNKIKKTLDIKFHSKPVYVKKYIKTKIETFNVVVNTVFSDDKVSKESIHYICIAAKNIDSVKFIIFKFIQKNANIR